MASCIESSGVGELIAVPVVSLALSSAMLTIWGVTWWKQPRTRSIVSWYEFGACMLVIFSSGFSLLLEILLSWCAGSGDSIAASLGAFITVNLSRLIILYMLLVPFSNAFLSYLNLPPKRRRCIQVAHLALTAFLAILTVVVIVREPIEYKAAESALEDWESTEPYSSLGSYSRSAYQLTLFVNLFVLFVCFYIIGMFVRWSGTLRYSALASLSWFLLFLLFCTFFLLLFGDGSEFWLGFDIGAIVTLCINISLPLVGMLFVFFAREFVKYELKRDSLLEDPDELDEDYDRVIWLKDEQPNGARLGVGWNASLLSPRERAASANVARGLESRRPLMSGASSFSHSHSPTPSPSSPQVDGVERMMPGTAF